MNKADKLEAIQEIQQAVDPEVFQRALAEYLEDSDIAGLRSYCGFDVDEDEEEEDDEDDEDDLARLTDEAEDDEDDYNNDEQ